MRSIARATRSRRALPTRSARTRAPIQGMTTPVGSPGEMKLGLALPQYDYSVAGEPGGVLRWDTVVEFATVAERAGYDSLWLSDHLCLDLARYRGPSTAYGL